MKQNETLRRAILERLCTVIDPETNIDVVRMRLIDDLQVDEDCRVSCVFRPSSVFCPIAVPLSVSIQNAIAETPGVMISLSFMGLMNEALALTDIWTAGAGFGAGAFFMLAVDFALPHMRLGERGVPSQSQVERRPGRHQHGQLNHLERTAARKLYQTGALLAVGITIHNLPEGIAVGAGYTHTPQCGTVIHQHYTATGIILGALFVPLLIGIFGV